MVDIRLLDSKRDYCWEKFFIKSCGLDYEEYRLNEEILTCEILEEYLDDIVDQIIGFIDYTHNPALRPRLPWHGKGYWVLSVDDILVGLQILGVLILQTGAYLPDIVRKGILFSTLWEYDKWRGWSQPFEKERKENLKKFRKAILMHKTGTKTKINF